MQGWLFPFEIANASDAFVLLFEPINRDDACDRRMRERLENDGCKMTMTSTFAQVKVGNGISARMRRVGAFLRRCGAAWLRGMHEQRRREAARVIAHERYLAGLDCATRLDPDVRPKVVPLRRSPVMQPSQECGTI